MLLAADIVAIAGAFLAVTQLSPRPLQLTWLSIAGLALLLLGAKLFGLYDRDETLLRKDDARRGAQAVPPGDLLCAGGVPRQ